MNNTEIERKFTLAYFPPIDNGQYISTQHIQQYYLPCNNGVMRIRKSNSLYFLTHKRRDDQYDTCVSEEFEEPITKTVFELLKRSAISRIEKIRHKIEFNDNIWEIDHFIVSTMGSFLMAEVELRFIDDEIVLIDGIDEEVSKDDLYKNENLAVKL